MVTPPARDPPGGGWLSVAALDGRKAPSIDSPWAAAIGRSPRASGISHGAVGTTVLRAPAAGLAWVQVQALTDDAPEGRLYDLREVAGRRKPGVTLELLHLEYLEQHPDGYRYAQFCEIYRRWLSRRGLSMRQVHHGGEKLFVDYAGQKPAFIDPARGERIPVELFVAVLGASNYTYAEATLTQQVPDWIASHQRAFAFVGGVTAAVVCDQLKSGVVIRCRYEAGLPRTYEELAQHHGTVNLPGGLVKKGVNEIRRRPSHRGGSLHALR